MLHDLAHQTELKGAICVHALVLSHQCHAHADVKGKHTGETHHLARRDDSDADVGVEESRLLRGDHDVTGGDEVEPRTTADAVYRAHDGLGHFAEGRRGLPRRLPLGVGAEVGLRVADLATLGDVAHVGAGAESTPGSRHDEGPDLRVLFRRGEGVGEFPLHLLRDGVQDVGAVEGDGRDAVAHLEEDVFIAHAGVSLGGREQGSALMVGDHDTRRECASQYGSRSTRLRTLPLALRGSSFTKSTERGRL